MDTMQDELAVATVNERFYRALENADLATMEALWLHADWVKCVHPGWELLLGWEAIRETWARIFSSKAGMRVTATDVNIVLAGDFAWVSCAENLALFLDSSSAPTSATTTATNLFKRVDGAWRMILHHASQIPDESDVTESELIQ